MTAAALNLTPAGSVLAAAPAAQSPRAAVEVSTAWLAGHLADPDLVLLHVGAEDAYAARHIPGARLVRMSDVAQTADGLRLQMLPADGLRAALADWGISDRSRIVVYYVRSELTQATRILFTLDYAGLGDRASILSGGMTAWTAEGRPVTTDVPAPRTGTLSPLQLRPLVVDADFVNGHRATSGYRVVDARLTPFYDGTQTGGTQSAPHRAGHIASAGSIPYSSLVDDEGRVKPDADLRAAFDAAGVKPGDTVVGYCHIGQQATAMLYAARALGHPVLLYDGSFEDWSRRAGLPVETGPQRVIR
ncbi:MAG: rhodanese-like domain-containing protein [Vicinamibacterales bacterium]